jgi:hypothetical protein
LADACICLFFFLTYEATEASETAHATSTEP